jgi:outer membrane protein OmpA-like peptidoglycan-associated protein
MNITRTLTKTPLALLTVAALVLAACGGMEDRYSDGTNSRATDGAIAGAVLGGVIGANTNDSNRGTGAVVGAVLGGIAGGAIGNELDQQAAELRGSLGNGISVTNMGGYLVVNMPQDLLFDVDSAALRPDLTRDLQTVAASLLKYPNTSVEVIGHTDNSGSAAYNQDLSQRRASSVASVLIGNGVPSGRVSSYGRGEDQPIASNLTDAGMAQNRRVEIIVRPNA